MKRILFAIPIPYWEGGFWTRDSGLVVLALRELGYDAWMVVLESGQDPKNNPLILASLEDLKTPDWWKAQRPDAVVLSTWSAPRYDAIRKAALTATPRILERLDTDGVRSARLFPLAYFIRTWGAWCDRLPRRFRWLIGPVALAEAAIRYLFSSYFDGRMAATMKRLPGLMAESPIAGRRIQQILESSPGASPQIRIIPHPVNEGDIRHTGMPKENRIITVGRWASTQKDFPLVEKVLRDFLRRHPDWVATVVGGGVPSGATAGDEIGRRIVYHEKLIHQDLAIEYNRSKIYLLASRYESFCIAAAEALCCGCSVVGSSEIPSAFSFADSRSGQVATARTPGAFAKSLDAEVEAWKAGERDPAAIAAAWKERAGSLAVAHATLAFLDELSSSGSSPG